MALDTSRNEFGMRQAEMTARWYENVKRAHGDVDAYITSRHNAYLDRWREAARFIPNKSRVLDIGGGNVFPALIDFFIQREFVYAYVDVDPAAVDSSRAIADSQGLRGSSFAQGYNDALAFPDESFDCVFSSHCLEHSIDLIKTFQELNRVLVSGGNLLMAVPFGWEPNPEHPYFFGPQEWVSIVMDSGFEIRVAQIGREYPEQGYDYFLACRKIGKAVKLRFDPEAYTKESFSFVSCFDESLSYHGESIRKEDHVILTEEGQCIEFRVPSDVQHVLPIFGRHDWSGIVEVSWGEASVVEDLYSWFPYAQPVRVAAAKNGGDPIARFRAVGRNASSHSSQLVLYGIHYR